MCTEVLLLIINTWKCIDSLEVWGNPVVSYPAFLATRDYRSQSIEAIPPPLIHNWMATGYATGQVPKKDQDYYTSPTRIAQPCHPYYHVRHYTTRFLRDTLRYFFYMNHSE